MTTPVFSKDWRVVKPSGNYIIPNNFICDKEGIIGLVKEDDDALLASLAPKMYLVIRNILFLSRLHGYGKLLGSNQIDIEEIVASVEGCIVEKTTTREVYCP